MDWKHTYQEWKNHPSLDPESKKSLEEMENDEKEQEEAFYAPLEFGTAGMRGILGAGINRMNRYTVRQATEGLALLISQKGEEAKERGVAIAYDSRHKSPEFALEAGKVLGQHGIKAYVFESLCPTPELSFAVRHLNAVAGIMITASHNPAEYNGYKVYGEDGGQMPPEDAGKLTKLVREIRDILSLKVADAEELKEKELLVMIGEEVDEAYLKEMRSVTQDPALIKRMGDKVQIVFTPLHGTGKMMGERALKQAGFKQVSLVEEQAESDPNFSTVTSPNPEDPAAFEYAEKKGRSVDADVLIATDPDADRLGMAVKTGEGEYVVLTGNQIASLMLDYLLKAQTTNQTLPKNGVVIKSIVSSELPTAIAERHGVAAENVLTGFKFIAEKIAQYEQTNEKQFLFGFEESYGYLVKPFVRDKDAIQALVLAAEMTAYHKEQGRTLFEALETLYEEYGHYEEKTISVTLSGIEGSRKIKQLMENLQENPPASFAGIDVTTREDFKKGLSVDGLGKETPLDFPSSDALKFKLADGSWIAIRPSGTEPKIKFYIGVKDESKSAASEKLQRFETEIQEIANA